MRNRLFNYNIAFKTLKKVLERYIMSNVAKAGKRISESCKNKNAGRMFVNSKGEVEYRKSWLLNIMELYRKPFASPSMRDNCIPKNTVCIADKIEKNSPEIGDADKSQKVDQIYTVVDSINFIYNGWFDNLNGRQVTQEDLQNLSDSICISLLNHARNRNMLVNTRLGGCHAF